MVGKKERDRISVFSRSAKHLHLSFLVVRDDTVGRVQDRCRRTVILLELDDFGVLKILFKIQDVSKVGTTERIDRLVIVTDDTEVSVALCEKLDQDVLAVVRVLILVDKNVAELLLIHRKNIRILLEKAYGIKQDIVKVHRVIGKEPVVIAAVDPRDRRKTHVASGQSGKLFRRLHVVFRLADDGLHQTRREKLVVEFHLLNDFLDDLELVIRIQDRIRRRVIQKLRVAAQDTGKHGVEGSDPHVSRSVADQGVDTFPHLVCGLVGERNSKDIRWPDPSNTDQIRDTVRDHARFSRAGAGQDQKRTLVMQDRLPLFIIQFF